MDHSRGFGVNLIAVNHHNGVQFLEIHPEPSRQAYSSMALQGGKCKPVDLVMRYYIVYISVAEITYAIKKDDILIKI
jgi:hypothetical protein